jgi:hypothetical protein
VINTGTTIVTFLMVFVIQNSQNRNSKALHLKIDELIRALDEARNDFVTVEQASDEELQAREDEMTALAQDVAIEVGGPKAEETVRRVERRVARTSPSAARGERSKSTRPTGGRSNGRSHRAKAGAGDTSAKADKAGKVGKGT